MSLSIPADKVREVLEYVERCKSARSLHCKQLQSLIGKLMHLAKCVPPARVFMSRIIEALRDMKGAHFTRVTPSIRADLEWFAQFAAAWNGKSLIPQGPPYRTIQVDACLTGIGATDGTLAYAGRIAPDEDPVANITEIEAANLVIALHTFITENDRGRHVKIECDNQATVQALLYGRAHNKILCECARAVWMVQALFDLKLTFVHLPGKDNQVADALSRAHTSNLFYSTASEMINTSNLLWIQPCTYVLSFLVPAILSRSGIQLAGSEGGGSTASGASGGDHGGTPSRRQGPLILRPPVPDGPDADDGRRRVPMDRAPHHGRRITGHRAEQGLQREGLRATGWRQPRGFQPHPCRQGARRSGEEDRLHHVQEAGHPPGPSEGCSQGHPRRPQRQYAENCSVVDVFRCPQTVQGGATNHGSFQPGAPPHACRYNPVTRGQAGHQTRKEPTKIQSEQSCQTVPHRRHADMPSWGSDVGVGSYATGNSVLPTVGIQEHRAPHPNLTLEGGLGCGHQEGWGRPVNVLTTQSEEDGRNSRLQGRLHGTRNTATRGVVLRGSQRRRPHAK